MIALLADAQPCLIRPSGAVDRNVYRLHTKKPPPEPHGRARQHTQLHLQISLQSDGRPAALIPEIFNVPYRSQYLYSFLSKNYIKYQNINCWEYGISIVRIKPTF